MFYSDRLLQLVFLCTLGLAVVSGCGQQAPPSSIVTDAGGKSATGEKPATVDSVAAEPSAAEAPFELEPDFQLLKRDDFDAFAAEPTTWIATADGIQCSGKPKGYLYSKHPYQNFTWRIEYRFTRPKSLQDEAKFGGNTGFLVYINGEHKLWPVCLEVQGKHIQMAAIKENGGAEPVAVEENEVARAESRKPVGQWNSLEIVSKDGAVTASLNGTPISSSKPGNLMSGLIGIQAEGHPFEARRMRIRTD